MTVVFCFHNKTTAINIQVSVRRKKETCRMNTHKRLSQHTNGILVLQENTADVQCLIKSMFVKTEMTKTQYEQFKKQLLMIYI